MMARAEVTTHQVNPERFQTRLRIGGFWRLAQQQGSDLFDRFLEA
jgi:hypothetical protein